MSLQDIIAAEAETLRFLQRIQEAKKRFQEDERAQYGCKQSGALKRAAMDLKNELTNLRR